MSLPPQRDVSADRHSRRWTTLLVAMRRQIEVPLLMIGVIVMWLFDLKL